MTQTEKMGGNLNVVMASKYKNIGGYQANPVAEGEKREKGALEMLEDKYRKPIFAKKDEN